MCKKPLPNIYQPLDTIQWKHTDANGVPLATFENIQCVIDAYGVMIARPPQHQDDFTPFFGERYYAHPADQLCDFHRAQLYGICQRNSLNVKLRTVERYVQMRGLEIEDTARRATNKKRLKRAGYRLKPDRQEVPPHREFFLRSIDKQGVS